MRNATLVRCLLLIELLKTGRFTLTALAQEFRVTTRTIRRDLEALSVAAIPVRLVKTDAGQTLWWVEHRP